MDIPTDRTAPESNANFAQKCGGLARRLRESSLILTGRRSLRYDATCHMAFPVAPTPGSKVLYSNIGVKLISFGLEHVYGDSYANLLPKHILKPLHMPCTGLTVAPRNQSLLVHGYGVSGKEMPHTLPNAGAAGGLYSTAEDLAKYAKWQLAERDPIVQKSHELIRGDLRDFGMGLIWDEAMVDGARRLWHSGGADGMSSQMELFPDAGFGIVLLANDGGFDTQHQLDQVAMSIRRALRSVPVDAHP